MPQITFITTNGETYLVDAKIGQSVMQAAVDNLVPGVLAECGGFCSCATCHAYVEKPGMAPLPPCEELEQDLLAGSEGAGPNSRLTCQIQVTEHIDGMVLRVAAAQSY
ncbi:2Fe-2S iron-sulfur cluster binding domain-containing protein [Burkholderia sp. R-69980]|nr:2Fe-2S iron-sulfur cluster binding domain-containing protein [Burkholderia sp. R-69980]